MTPIKIQIIISGVLDTYANRNQIPDNSNSETYYFWLYNCYLHYTENLNIQTCPKIREQIISDFQTTINQDQIIISSEIVEVIIANLLILIKATNHLMLLRDEST